jgi:hypothetical protein
MLSNVVLTTVPFVGAVWAVGHVVAALAESQAAAGARPAGELGRTAA